MGFEADWRWPPRPGRYEPAAHRQRNRRRTMSWNGRKRIGSVAHLAPESRAMGRIAATSNRRALVYRGPAASPGCPEAVAALLQTVDPGFDVEFIGPQEPLAITKNTLRTAAIYVQPGGGKNLQRAFQYMKRHTSALRSYVAAGGRYLGICMGGYLAGHWRGFGLLPGDADQFITSDHADVTTDRDCLVQVDWRGRRRHMFFQDGPMFQVPTLAQEDVVVLARYASNNEVAALVAPFGRGKVGVCGPHPEAPESWYAAHRLVKPDGLGRDLGHDLIRTLIAV